MIWMVVAGSRQQLRSVCLTPALLVVALSSALLLLLFARRAEAPSGERYSGPRRALLWVNWYSPWPSVKWWDCFALGLWPDYPLQLSQCFAYSCV